VIAHGEKWSLSGYSSDEGETAAVPARAPAPTDPAPVRAAPAAPADPAARGPAAAASRNSFSVWTKEQVEAAITGKAGAGAFIRVAIKGSLR